MEETERHSRLAIGGQVVGKGVLAVEDLGEGFGVIGFIERETATYQHVENDTEGPDVWKEMG